MEYLDYIKRDRRLLICIIVLCIIISSSTLFLILQNTGTSTGDGLGITLGSIVLPIIEYISYIALPITFLTKYFLSLISYIPYSFYNSPTLTKFIPIITIPAYSFLLGFIFMCIYIKKVYAQETAEKQLIRFKYAKQKFLVIYLIFVFIVGAYVFTVAPPPPFASVSSIMYSCSYSYKDKDCTINYILSRASNCENEKPLFLFPFKTRIYTVNDLDQCVFENFILNKPLNFRLHPDYSDKIIIIFKKYLDSANSEKKLSFCGSFSDSVKNHCSIILGLIQDNSNLDSSNCISSLFRQKYENLDLQKFCVSKLINFDIYQPKNKELWEGKFIYTIEKPLSYYKMSIYDIHPYDTNLYNKLDPQGTVIYLLDSTKDKSQIMELSTSDPIYSRFKNSLSTKDYTEVTYERIEEGRFISQDFVKRVSFEKIKIGDIDVYIEKVEKKRKDSHKGEIRIIDLPRSIYSAYFVKNNTFIVIKNDTIDKSQPSKDSLIEMVKSIIE